MAITSLCSKIQRYTRTYWGSNTEFQIFLSVWVNFIAFLLLLYWVCLFLASIGNIGSNFKLLLYEQSPKYVRALVKVVVVAEVLVLLANDNGHPIPVSLNIRYESFLGLNRSEAPHWGLGWPTETNILNLFGKSKNDKTKCFSIC